MIKFQHLPAPIQYSEAECEYLENIKSRITTGPIDEAIRPKLYPSLAKAFVHCQEVKMKELLKTMKEKLLNLQGPYCIYCGEVADDIRDLEREHIAPKETYPEFTFEPYNLALSCSICNGFIRKYTNDTIISYNENYSLCKFNIIHPYFDYYNDYISFEENISQKKLVLKSKDSVDSENPKGMNTIAMFKLNSNKHLRYRYAFLERTEYSVSQIGEEMLEDIIREGR